MSNEDWRELDESYRSALSGALQTARPSVEQAGGDERAAVRRLSEEAESTVIGMVEYCLNARVCLGMDEGFKSFDPEEEHDFVKELREFVEARAALAQPSPKCATCGGTGMVDDGEITCSEGGIPYENGPVKCVKDCPDCKAQPSPAQAEAERPEVVARVVHSNPVVLGQCGPLNANDELMTVAQHAASVARWAEMFNRVEQQRDAALARVAELEALMQMNFGELHTARNLLSRLSVSGVNVDAILGGQLQDLVIVPADATLEMVEALKRSLTVTNRGTLLNAGHALNASIAASPFAKKAPEPVMCPRCEGEGTLRTGIDESPSTICKRCDGVGTIAAAPGKEGV
ncbi:hypothetical protein ACIUV2_27225 [Pseudomonas aeruginosa]